MFLRIPLYFLILSSAQAQFVFQSALAGNDAVWKPLDPCDCPGAGVNEGWAVAISADGTTAINGGYGDSAAGAAWIFVRNNGAWTQQGPKLLPADAIAPSSFGYSVALSADGNTALIGGELDNSLAGAIWIFVRTNGVWAQQGSKLVGSGTKTYFGSSVALSADGNTAAASALIPGASALLVFTRTNGVWSQEGNPVTGNGAGIGLGSISGDGNTIIATTATGALIFVRTNGVWSQQGGQLSGNDAADPAYAGGLSAALSSDGNTAMVGSPGDSNAQGAAWIFTRTNGIWTQQGNKLTAPHSLPFPRPGLTSSLSADGSTALTSVFVFRKSASGVWSPSGSLPIGVQPTTLSADGQTALVGDPGFSLYGRALVFAVPRATTVDVSPSSGTGSSTTMSFSFSDAGGWQNLQVVDVLINTTLDGRQACYFAFVPSSSVTGTLYMVANGGGPGGYAVSSLAPGATGGVANQQCTVSGTGNSVSANGDTLTLTLRITFDPSFVGNHVIYVSAQDGQGTSGWQPLGTWNVSPPLAPPAVSGMTPSRTTGATQTYTFTFTDSVGWQDIGIVDVLIHSALDGSNACYFAFMPTGASAGTLYLVDNAGDAGGPYQAMALSGSGAVSNAQCSISGTGSSVSASGTGLALTIPITFNPIFSGNQIVYAAVRGGSGNSGWQPVGTASIP